MRKKRIVQMELDFKINQHTLDDDIMLYYSAFKTIAKKLWAEKRSGKNTTGGFGCPAWWHSRYCDFLTDTNSKHKSDEEWQWRAKGFNLWSEIWNRFSNQLTQGEF